MHLTPEIIALAKAIYEAMIANPSPENVAKAKAIKSTVGVKFYEKMINEATIAQDMGSP